MRNDYLQLFTVNKRHLDAFAHFVLLNGVCLALRADNDWLSFYEQYSACHRSQSRTLAAPLSLFMPKLIETTE